MDAALAQARLGLQNGDAPIGSVLLGEDGRVICGAFNTMHSSGNPIAHAEINAFTASVGQIREDETLTLVASLEPCVMCVSAAMQVGVRHIVFGLSAPADAGKDRVDLPNTPSAAAPSFTGGIRASESRSLFKQWLAMYALDSVRNKQRQFIEQLMALTANIEPVA